MYNRLYEFLTVDNILYQYQFCFRKRKILLQWLLLAFLVAHHL